MNSEAELNTKAELHASVVYYEPLVHVTWFVSSTRMDDPATNNENYSEVISACKYTKWLLIKKRKSPIWNSLQKYGLISWKGNKL